MYFPVEFLTVFAFLTSVGNFLLGLFSAVWPRKSIGLYIWLMGRMNWSVKPLDEAREIQNTRRFGYTLMILSLATMAVSLQKILR